MARPVPIGVLSPVGAFPFGFGVTFLLECIQELFKYYWVGHSTIRPNFLYTRPFTRPPEGSVSSNRLASAMGAALHQWYGAWQFGRDERLRVHGGVLWGVRP